MFREEQQIGLYKLIHKLGKGGFGEVWLAEKRSELVTKKVAIKLPLGEQVNIETIRQEASLWEQASGHSNVLPIIDADIYNGQVVIVSEYADGGSLADRLKTQGKLSIKEAIDMTIGVLNGLEYLHSKRIIHRDIKPANILLQGNTPRLADFGISRAMQTEAVSSTIIGTDAYMSPESFEGKRSVQTDIWAVGIVLYQLLTGNLPFPQEHPTERMFAVLLKEPEPLPDEIPQRLIEIIYKALEKDRELGQELPKRYQTTAQMREDLQNFLVNFSQSQNQSNQSTSVLPPKSVVEHNSDARQPSIATVISPLRTESTRKVIPANIQTFSSVKTIVVWLFLCLIWGTTWVFIAVGLKYLPPMTFAATRFILAVSILAIIIFLQKIPLPKTAREWKLIALTGVLQFSLNYSLVFWSEQYISSGLAAVLQAMITVFGLALAWIHLPSEKITWLKVFAVLLGITGVATIFIEQLQINNWMAFAGCAAVVVGAYAAAHASILIKAKGGKIHPASLVFCQMSCGVIPIIIYALIKEGNPLDFNWTWQAIVCILYLTIFGTIVAFWLYYWLLSKIESTKAMMISLVTPLLAVVIGAIFLGEKLPPQTFFGGILILASIGLIVFRKKINHPLRDTENTEEIKSV